MTDFPATALPRHPDGMLVAHLAAIRRALHRHPELSWLEYRTTAETAERLASLGFTVTAGASLYHQEPHNWPPASERAAAWQQAASELGQDHHWLQACREGYSGLVATLDSGNPGPCHGFRFDLDALPITEALDQAHQPAAAGFASQHPGIMHACGHDAHITAGIGLAERLVADLQQNPQAWSGKVHLFFQPAEEVAGGGRYFAELPQLQEVERFATFHIGITGRREIVLDASWLGARILDIAITGRSSHAGNAPEAGHNALLAACTAIQNLYALPRHSGGISRVNVGRLHSANAQNVISDLCSFRLEVRGSDDVVCDDLLARAQQIIQGAAAMQACTAELREVSRFEAQANHPGLVDELEHSLQALGIPATALRRSYQVPASEDATCLSRTVQQNGGQATHLLIACDTRGGHHNPRFDFDEDLMAWAVAICHRMVVSV
ncbi:MAG: amidohydrolase [Pseudomonadales bacterium]|nr:amidohydrolase [Pseudomonadales bacterium]